MGWYIFDHTLFNIFAITSYSFKDISYESNILYFPINTFQEIISKVLSYDQISNYASFAKQCHESLKKILFQSSMWEFD